jgi:hypothetical protein
MKVGSKRKIAKIREHTLTPPTLECWKKNICEVCDKREGCWNMNVPSAALSKALQRSCESLHCRRVTCGGG